MSTGHSRRYTDIKLFPFVAVTSSSAQSYLIINKGALWNLSYRGRSNHWTIYEVQVMAGHTQTHTPCWPGVLRKTEMLNDNDTWWPAHLAASKAAPKWFDYHHDVNICGFDCIMGWSVAGRWSISGKTELFVSKKVTEGYRAALLTSSVSQIENVQPR